MVMNRAVIETSLLTIPDYLNYNKALIRKLNLNKKPLQLDLHTICKYLNFKIDSYAIQEIEFTDDITTREDINKLLCYLNNINIDRVTIHLPLHNMVKCINIFNTKINPTVTIPTLDSVVYNTIYNTNLTATDLQEMLSHLSHGQIVEIPLLAHNMETVRGVIEICWSKNITPILYIPICTTQQEHALNPTTPSSDSIIKLLGNLIDIPADKIVLVEDIPRCILGDMSLPMNVRFINNLREYNYMSVDGIKDGFSLNNLQYSRIQKCTDCYRLKYCNGIHYYYK